MFTPRRKLALAVGLAGLGVVGGGIAFGVAANHRNDEARERCPVPGQMCAFADQSNALRDLAQSHALVANVGYAIGGTAIAGAIALWFLGAPERREPNFSISPRVGGPGVDVQARF